MARALIRCRERVPLHFVEVMAGSRFATWAMAALSRPARGLLRLFLRVEFCADLC